MADTEEDNSDLYVGLTDLDLNESPIDLGEGLQLRTTKVKFLSPLTLVNTENTTTKTGEIRPSYWQFNAEAINVTTELLIPASAASSFEKRFALARLVVFLIRLWTNPAVGLHVLSDHKFCTLHSLSEKTKPAVIPVETFRRYFSLGLVDQSQITSSLFWVKENWETANRLYTSSPEFRLAADAIDSGQFIPNSALTLLSLWGALEAIFSPSTSELKFRVSALIASYLEPPGDKRIELQKNIAALYDKRSAAAHGKPKHENEDLLKTFELLRKVLIRMIHKKSVPTKEELERCLFVGTV